MMLPLTHTNYVASTVDFDVTTLTRNFVKQTTCQDSTIYCDLSPAPHNRETTATTMTNWLPWYNIYTAGHVYVKLIQRQ
jgi:hypothetical protein